MAEGRCALPATATSSVQNALPAAVSKTLRSFEDGATDGLKGEVRCPLPPTQLSTRRYQPQNRNSKDLQ